MHLWQQPEYLTNVGYFIWTLERKHPVTFLLHDMGRHFSITLSTYNPMIFYQACWFIYTIIRIYTRNLWYLSMSLYLIDFVHRLYASRSELHNHVFKNIELGIFFEFVIPSWNLRTLNLYFVLIYPLIGTNSLVLWR